MGIKITEVYLLSDLAPTSIQQGVWDSYRKESVRHTKSTTDHEAPRQPH
jgi:hypothetical protein